MARIDLNEENGWIPEESGSQVITTVDQVSAVERLARRENMTTRTKAVARYVGTDVDIVPEAGVIPEVSPELDEVVLTAVKFANRFRISEEDLNDSLPGTLDRFKNGWANSFARKLDHACLGTVGNPTSVNRPFLSVYQAATNAGTVTKTQGNVVFEALSDSLATLEAGEYFNPGRLVVIVHPQFAGFIRNLRDSAGDRVATEPLAGGNGSVFGYPLVYSRAMTGATATASPDGNPLLIMGNADHLILGVRSGPESQVTDVANWTTDEPELKMRARRGFTVADGNAFVVLEKTAAGAV
jgi:HK97 family phage major capsid protein